MSEPNIMQFFAIVATLPDNAERAAALRKLLEAKDVAVRALVAKRCYGRRSSRLCCSRKI